MVISGQGQQVGKSRKSGIHANKIIKFTYIRISSVITRIVSDIEYNKTKDLRYMLCRLDNQRYRLLSPQVRDTSISSG